MMSTGRTAIPTTKDQHPLENKSSIRLVVLLNVVGVETTRTVSFAAMLKVLCPKNSKDVRKADCLGKHLIKGLIVSKNYYSNKLFRGLMKFIKY